MSNDALPKLLESSRSSPRAMARSVAVDAKLMGVALDGGWGLTAGIQGSFRAHRAVRLRGQAREQ